MMSGPDTNWRDRCEMFFSSMDKYNDQEHRKEIKRKRSNRSKVNVTDENGVHYPGIQPEFYEGNITFSKEKKSFKGLIRWLSGIDLHGTRMLQRSGSHLFCLVWISITIIGCGLCGVGFYKYINEYMEEDYEIRTRVVSDGGNASPLSLMLCNKNLIQKSKIPQDSRFYGLDILNVTYLQNLGIIQSSGKPSVESVLANTELLTFLTEKNLMEASTGLLVDLNEEYVSFSEMVNESDWESVGRSMLQIDDDPFPRAFRLTSSELRDLGHEMNLSILGCTKNGRRCDSSEISFVQNAEFGQCAVIHLSLEGSWFDTLTLTLDVQPEEYLNLASPSPGFRAIVQSESSLSTSWLPITSHDFVVANPGEGLHLAVSKDCVSRCLVLHTASVCGCSISLPSPLSQRCRVDIQYEFLCHRLLRELYQRNQLPCDCPQYCKEEFLDVTASTFNWIKNDSEALLSASIELAGKMNNFTDIRDSVTKVQVSWSHSPYIKLVEEDKLSLMGLFLQLGSVSAITVGVSVITILELIWLLGKTVTHLCCAVNKNRDRHSDAVQHILPVQHIYPEFDNIGDNRNWFTNGVQGQGHNQMQSHAAPQPPATLGLANSPLNKRRINNYIVQPTSHQADYNGYNNHTSAISAQGEFIYRGKPRESGLVYGETSASKEMSPPIMDAQTGSPDIHRKKMKKSENELLSQPWDRSGKLGVYSRVFIPHQNSSENKEVPLFNSPYITVGEDHIETGGKGINDKSEDLESEGNTFNHITKSIHTSDNSKTTGSGQLSKTESQRHADNDLNRETRCDNDFDDDGHGGGNDDGNIFKISQAEMNDISWIPEDNTNAQGPDLSSFNTFLLTSTHKPPKIYTTSQEGQNYKNRHQHLPRNTRAQRGFGRTAKKNDVDNNVMHETTPVHGNGIVQRNRLLSPNTWHNYIVSSENPLPPPPPLMAQPVSYVLHGYHGKDAIYN